MAKSQRGRFKFMATIYRIWMMRHIDVPTEVSDALAKIYHGGIVRQRIDANPKYIPVLAIVNGRSARATLVPAGAGRYRMQINTALRQAARADAGDVVTVELRLDRDSRDVAVPPDLRAGLREHPKAWKAFEALASGQRRQFIQWFDSAKAPETREKRLARAVDVLLERALLSPRRRKASSEHP